MAEFLALGLVLFMVAFMVVSTMLLNGWALVVLWGWFAVPYGLPPLTIPFALGLIIVARFLAGETVDKSVQIEATPTSILNGILKLWSRPVVAVMVGWCVQRFI